MVDQEILPIFASDEFFALPLLEDGESRGQFVAQVHFCTDRARTPDECSFIVVEGSHGGRPECPQHQRQSMSWGNVYDLDGTTYRQSY